MIATCLNGERYGRLTVIDERAGKRNGHRLVRCVCDCGKETVTKAIKLRSGWTKSCGCFKNERVSARRRKHGKSHTRAYSAWLSMHNRCTDTRLKMYHRYGGRGISVCERWSDFESFYLDMGEAPKGTSLDRINNDGNYEPSNCRWASKRVQDNNRSTTIFLEYQGEKLPLQMWAERLRIKAPTLRTRLNRGWTLADAFAGTTFGRWNGPHARHARKK